MESDIFVGFQKGRSGLEKRRFWHQFVLWGHAVLLPGSVSQAFASSNSKSSQLAASQQLLTACNKVEIRWKNASFVGFVGFQKGVLLPGSV